MPDSQAQQEWLKSKCHEIRALPPGWIAKVAPENGDHPKRIYFVKVGTRESNFAHPTLGLLPKPWILRLCSTSNGDSIRYFNPRTMESIVQDPRFNSKILRSQSEQERDPDRRIASAITKMTSRTSLEDMYRDDVGTKNIREHYHIVHAIDPGDGSIGAMNGGVFVVKLKGTERLCIEKRFKTKTKSDIAMAKMEMKMLHRLKHGSLTFYVAGFMTEYAPIAASVYVEFCDRGSLQDLIDAYRKKRKDERDGPRVPERFLWHAFGGLCDGLAYLRGGRSYIAMNNKDYSTKKGWIPVLHRDMKPDNVLLRSRDTLGKNRYYYCVLSDFGLACEDLPDKHPDADKYQAAGSKLGTTSFLAPELLYNPCPTTDTERHFFPKGFKHSAKTDLWSLAASIYILAYLDGQTSSHINMEHWGKCAKDDFYSGQCSRKEVLKLPSCYSEELNEALTLAGQWLPEDRPGPIEMVRKMKALMRSSGFTTSEWKSKSEEIPEWATRKHEFLAKKPLDPSKFQ